MTPRSERNVANILILVGLIPTVPWLGLMAISSALMPWVAAGLVWLGVPLCFLSLLVSGSASVWARNLTKANPEIWRGAQRIPGWIAVVVGGLVVCTVLTLIVQSSVAVHPPAQSITLTPEENARIEKQFRAKVEEMTGKPYAPIAPSQ